MSTTSRTRQVVAAFFSILLLLIIVLAIFFPPREHLPIASWGESLETAGAAGAAMFLLLGMLATAVGLPRQLAAFIGGLAYGVSLGLTLSLLAALAGCIVTVTVSRNFFAAYVVGRFPKPIAVLENLVKTDFFLKVLVLRLQPFGTNLLSNVCIGFTSASLAKYVAASAVGYIPQMLVFSLLGAGVRVDSQAQLSLSIALLIISILLGVYLYKRHLAIRDVDKS
jgi:uncharacterized membrane protein YdjX (TVP38/TMEM64 family)